MFSVAEVTSAPAAPPWPAVRDEERVWNSRRLASSDLGPYLSAITPEIAGATDIPMSAQTRSLIADTTVEVVRFDMEAGPLHRLLLVADAIGSSRIERINAPTLGIFLADSGTDASEHAALVAANAATTRFALEAADSLDAHAIVRMQAKLLGASRPALVGRFRDQQVWIGGALPHYATFVPPHAERVRDAMADLAGFMARTDLPPLAHAAVTHAQFETIHPFGDGNGRTGRALVHALLRRGGMTRAAVVPFSAALAGVTHSYYEALTAYREGDVEPIIVLLCETMWKSMGMARALNSDLHALRAGWTQQVSARRDATAWKAADLLTTAEPVIDSPMLQRVLGVSAPVALTAIEQLVEAKVLTKVSGKQRNRRYASAEVFRALDVFTTRSGRRG